MQAQVKHLTGEEIPEAWRPTWVVCWVVEMDGKIIAGPYGSEDEAKAAANGEKDPKISQTPTP